MLEVSQLSRSYGDFKAVDDVSFAVGSGEIVGLLGHNGAGKTTVMKMLTGYLEPDEGSVVVAGNALTTHLKKVQREIGYLPENLPVYPEMTVADYLDYAARLKGIRSANVNAEISRVAGETDLNEKIVDPIATLSRGYRQRVGVAQAILGQPRLLILDEPTNGLDPTQTEQMRQLLRSIAQQATVILSTHIMQEVQALCDRVLMLRGGRLELDEPLNQLRTSDRLSIETSLDLNALNTSLFGLGGLQAEQIDCVAGANHYVLKLQPNEDHRSLSASIARAIAVAGGELYSLHVTQRDLESLFGEVSAPDLGSAKEMSHVA